MGDAELHGWPSLGTAVFNLAHSGIASPLSRRRPPASQPSSQCRPTNTVPHRPPAAMKPCCRALQAALMALAAVGAVVFLAGVAATHSACNQGAMGRCGQWAGHWRPPGMRWMRALDPQRLVVPAAATTAPRLPPAALQMTSRCSTASRCSPALVSGGGLGQAGAGLVGDGHVVV